MNKFFLFLLLTILSASMTGCSQRDKEAEAVARLETQKAERLAKEKQAAAEIERKKRELVVLKAAVEKHIYEQVALKGKDALKDPSIGSKIVALKGPNALTDLYKASPAEMTRTVTQMFPNSNIPLVQQTDHSGALKFTPEEVNFAASIDIDALTQDKIREIATVE